MLHTLSIELGLSLGHALAIISILHIEGIASVRLLIYHSCEADLPSGSIPYGTGLPKLPWQCSLCGEQALNYNELSFSIEAIVIQATEIF
jgi:hypothetical protein